MNIKKLNKIMNLILIVMIVYTIFIFFSQQKKLNSYNKEISYYNTQIEELNAKKAELLTTQENVNSEEYIEEVAREKLDMYLPNETVYIDMSK